MTILTVGIDVAKNVFAVHGVNESGRAELVRPVVARDKLSELIAALPACVIRMEACSGAHHCTRQFAAWLGLAPGQFSSGGKTRLGRITKAGDAYLRSLLVLGARALLAAAKNKTDSVSRWAVALAERRGYWKAVVAIAAKNARMAWAVLRKGEAFALPA